MLPAWCRMTHHFAVNVGFVSDGNGKATKQAKNADSAPKQQRFRRTMFLGFSARRFFLTRNDRCDAIEAALTFFPSWAVCSVSVGKFFRFPRLNKIGVQAVRRHRHRLRLIGIRQHMTHSDDDAALLRSIHWLMKHAEHAVETRIICEPGALSPFPAQRDKGRSARWRNCAVSNDQRAPKRINRFSNPSRFLKFVWFFRIRWRTKPVTIGLARETSSGATPPPKSAPPCSEGVAAGASVIPWQSESEAYSSFGGVLNEGLGRDEHVIFVVTRRRIRELVRHSKLFGSKGCRRFPACRQILAGISSIIQNTTSSSVNYQSRRKKASVRIARKPGSRKGAGVSQYRVGSWEPPQTVLPSSALHTPAIPHVECLTIRVSVIAVWLARYVPPC